MLYLEWNNLIAKHFFNEQMAGREVLLYVNQELIDSLGAEFRSGLPDFVAAMRNGPTWVTRSSICQKAFQAYINWRDKGLEYPPYIAYLSFFVLAASVEADFAPHAYYPRFWKLLDEPDSGTPPSFGRMIGLWDDLERWSREDKHEALGRFVARIRGNWWKVGLPLSQTLLSSEERNNLPTLFTAGGFDPTEPPSNEVMLNTLKRHGHEFFQKRTLRLLESKNDDDVILREGLVEFVLDELEQWDGSVLYEETGEQEQRHDRRLNQSGLRICLHTDFFSGNVSSYLRFKTGKVLPDEGLFLKNKDDGSVWFCSEAYKGWSTPLRSVDGEGDAVRLDASKVDWTNEHVFTDSERHWRARLKPASVRLFRMGLDGMPDWVESQKFERGIEFIVACLNSEKERIEAWGKQHVEQFKKKDVSGLPAGWNLYWGQNCDESCPGYDVLTISKTVRLLLRDGIKAGAGNAYFRFAPPKVVLENPLGAEVVTVNDTPLVQSREFSHIWELPENLEEGIPLRIEASVNGDGKLRRIIRFVGFELAESFPDCCVRNACGVVTQEKTDDYVCGVVVHTKKPNVSYPGILPTHLSNQIIFVGENPGEICEWPEESTPEAWQPVWAVTRINRKEWKAFYCGSSEKKPEEHAPGKSAYSKVDRKRWKDAIWVRRKIIQPPDLGLLRGLWKQYLEASRDV